MSLRKVMQKQKKQSITDSGVSEMSPIFFDIVCSANGGVTTWEVIYNRLEDKRPKITVIKATNDSIKPSVVQFKDAASSFLHRIGARAKILPYTDMIRWVVENLNIEDMKFRNSKMELMGSFKAEDLKQMYHIPNPHDIYDKSYLVNFAKKNEEPFKMIQGWRVLENKFKYDKTSMYLVASLENTYNYASSMLCRLYGLPNNTNFSIEWIPLIDACVNYHIMNFATILFDNLAIAISEYRQKRSTSTENLPPFYFSAYIMDAIYFYTKFPIMGWKWTLQDPYPIHLNHKQISESHYIPHFYKICHGVILPLHQFIFNKKAPMFSKEVATDLLVVGKYFVEEWFTYIRVFGSTMNPHVLPLYVFGKLLAREISHQIVGKGLTKTLKDNKKPLWPSFPIRCGYFLLENFNHATKESLSLESLKLHTLPKRQFDPDKITHNITIVAKIKPFNHEAKNPEDILQSVESFEQVFDWVKANLSPEYFEKFQKFRNQMLEIIPLHLLRVKGKPTSNVTINSQGPNSCIESQENTT